VIDLTPPVKIQQLLLVKMSMELLEEGEVLQLERNIHLPAGSVNRNHQKEDSSVPRSHCFRGHNNH